jgi:hypothetical protein
MNHSGAETAPGIAVPSSVTGQSVSLMTHQAPVPQQNVKVTVKLDPISDNLIIDNEPSPSVASDISDDTADMEVRHIMDPCSLEGSRWVCCNVQDSVVSSDKEASTQFPFPDISDDETLVLPLNTDNTTHISVQSCENPVEHNTVTSNVTPNEQIDNGLSAVNENERVDDSPCTVQLGEQVNYSLGHMAGSLDFSLKQAGQVENSVKQMPPHRTRKISWIAPAEPVEAKTTSGLERLLGLFHSPVSFFNKTQQQYKATPASVNPQPVACNNTSFFPAAGPLGSIANGGSVLLSSDSQSQTESNPHLLREILSLQTCTREVQTSVKQTPEVSRKERKTSNCENPIPDIINNNNNKVQEVIVLGSNDGGDENRSRLEGEEEREHITRHCEDENYNVPKLCEAIIKSQVPEGDAANSMSETLTCRSFEVGIAAVVKHTCNSKCNFLSKGSQNTDTLEAGDIETGLELLKLTDSSDNVIHTSQCIDEGSSTELNIESNAITNSPTNGVNIKPIPSCKRENDQFIVDFANGSPVNSGLTSDRLWSRTCDSPFVSVQHAAATVRLVGGGSQFSSYEMDIQRGDAASSQLLPDYIGKYIETCATICTS